MFFIENTRYKIKTVTGFEHFSGVVKKTVDTMYHIIFTDGTEIKCSGNHAFLTNVGFKRTSDITTLDTITGKKIFSIELEKGTFEVYDPVNVSNHNTYYSNDVISHNTEFIGSTSTLISSAKLKQLLVLQEPPTFKEDHLDIFEEPKPDHTYVLTADVAEGLGLDYSTFSIIDVTSMPYKQVAKYRNNEISPLLFPTKIVHAAKKYHDAFILIEINSIGLQVADIIHHDFAYDNLIKIEVKGKQGQQHTPGFKKKVAFGLKMNKQTKAIGCTNLKTLIESDKLMIRDEDTLKEFTTFVVNKQTYKAEDGGTDDLVMTLVHFGWLTSQKYFKENINSDIRKVLQKETMNILDTDLVPFGFIDDGLDDPFDDMDQDKDLWVVDRERSAPFENIDIDSLSNKWRL